MNQPFRDRFAALHVPGDPVLLYNIWDVASAQAVAASGARALATGSHAVAESQGFPDGEGIPFNLFLEATRRIVDGVDLPVTADFESGFAADPARSRSRSPPLPAGRRHRRCGGWLRGTG